MFSAAIVSMPKFSAYSTSKHALHGKLHWHNLRPEKLLQVPDEDPESETPLLYSPGFFKCLQQELIFTNTPVSITIMPLPYVLTNKVRAD